MKLRDQVLRGFQKVFPDCDPRTLEHYVDHGTGELPDTARLLLWDANSIHGFVFHSTNATAIRGASEILKSLDKELGAGTEVGLTKDQILFAGGGSGVAVVQLSEVDTVIAKIHDLFARRTLTSTCTITTVPLTASDGHFGDRIRAAYRLQERRRTVYGYGAEPIVPFFARRCEVCGKRAAAGHQPRKADPKRPECTVCTFCIERGKDHVRFQDEPGDFEDIADGRKFLAMIYLDGNGMGKTIRRLQSPLAFAIFSQTLEQIYERAFKTLAERYKLGSDDQRGTEGAFQLPIRGGDDLVAILPGEVAVPFTRDLLQELQQQTDDHPELQALLKAGTRLGAAAGVAISHLGYPIRHLLDEAQDLLRQAKERVYKGGARNALHFAVIKDGSPRAEERMTPRGLEYPPPILLEGGPYTLEEMEIFSRRFRTLLGSGIGRSQLFTLRREAEAGDHQLRNHILYQVGRHTEWRSLIAEWAGDKSVVLDKERCLDAVLPAYGEIPTLDSLDMLELHDHWREEVS